ncbi:acyl-CoA thioesterase [Tunicatimonas pelagia]|uniref:acyl-CoA thioesterase n=1 Tax=Tunicatimonas pelagia TaxID=931531 RepID=UPI002665E3DB|nr:acyl-CoA thioesterase [Tunicatimonas pelagia]WKN43075.1 acyl-CoA thioesterase [Tunicatimonas pelagia]
MPNQKNAQESFTTMTEMVFPNDTNGLNGLMGGRLLYWMDIVAAIAAQKHSNSYVVTASVDNVSFSHPIKIGNVVTLKAKVTRAFNTSMEVHIEVQAEDVPSSQVVESHRAFFTMVAVNLRGNKTKVPELIPETEEEQQLFAGALRRRQLRLVLAGRMKPDEANELRSIFDISDAPKQENA